MVGLAGGDPLDGVVIQQAVDQDAVLSAEGRGARIDRVSAVIQNRCVPAIGAGEKRLRAFLAENLAIDGHHRIKIAEQDRVAG